MGLRRSNAARLQGMGPEALCRSGVLSYFDFWYEQALTPLFVQSTEPVSGLSSNVRV